MLNEACIYISILTIRYPHIFSHLVLAFYLSAKGYTSIVLVSESLLSVVGYGNDTFRRRDPSSQNK